ncbi:hypothetical protein [Actinomadura madurae]|uniref:hypothetical protein n=1 Tax=Actinomadura madurae TaxID=1993 RepID=UPI0020D22AED|nr:hypothetical protein [Actinomadura madurae]MCQ0007836.1 hypothetical protein [Actinomadura madurae]
MSFTKAMGEVVRLPVPHPDHTTDPTDVDAPATAPGNAGAGVPPTDPPTSVPSGAAEGNEHGKERGDDDADALEGRVLVDRPDTFRPDVRARRMAGESAKRRPIVAPWLRDRAEAEATVRWAVGYAATSPATTPPGSRCTRCGWPCGHRAGCTG